MPGQGFTQTVGSEVPVCAPGKHLLQYTSRMPSRSAGKILLDPRYIVRYISCNISYEVSGDMSKEWWTHLGKDWWLRASMGAPLVDVSEPLMKNLGRRFYGLQFNRGRFFEIGEIRLAILSLLSEGPKHGYQLMKEMKERSGGVYSASAGSVYPTLQQLEDELLIKSVQQNGRRVYELTAAGREELAKDPDGVRRIWERAEECE